jgi:hypothetical protein
MPTIESSEGALAVWRSSPRCAMPRRAARTPASVVSAITLRMTRPGKGPGPVRASHRDGDYRCSGRRTLYFGRHDLEKGPRGAWRRLFATGVDPRFDYFPGVRRFDDLTLPRCAASQFRKRSRDPSRQVIVISHVAIRAMCTGSGGASRRLRSVVEPLNFLRRIDRPADHLDGRSYLPLSAP